MTTKHIALIALAALLVAGGVSFVLITNSKPSALEMRARRLRSVEPYGVGKKISFDRWSGPVETGLGPSVSAHYSGLGSASGFSMIFAADQGGAKAAFGTGKEDMSGLDELQQIDAFPSEFCAGRERTLLCIGYLGGDRNLYLASWARGIDPTDSDAGLDTLLLLRTARKHAFRVFKDF